MIFVSQPRSYANHNRLLQHCTIARAYYVVEAMGTKGCDLSGGYTVASDVVRQAATQIAEGPRSDFTNHFRFVSKSRCMREMNCNGCWSVVVTQAKMQQLFVKHVFRKLSLSYLVCMFCSIIQIYTLSFRFLLILDIWVNNVIIGQLDIDWIFGYIIKLLYLFWIVCTQLKEMVSKLSGYSLR
eukprot:TRINITY_DN16288_c0_g1_i2.p1 TRINITY_DN16288_c0_g1~~TRINITY_DN16288_c0_g1_i2.p1  ORF type:complete len:183 (+),score=1.21 TRINITY_DN16288_c0_g1_i2:183-731(+)